MVKKIMLLFMFFLVSMASFLNVKETSDLQLSDELLYRVNSSEEANALADTFNLEFVHLSKRNLATFTINDESNLQDALTYGFVYNSMNQSVGPPWGGGDGDTDPLINDQYALEMLDLFEAWELTEGIAEVTIAIIDTGIDINHEEFVDRISLLSYNSVTELVGLDHVIDDQGHGTSVAGVIGATKDNGKGIAGVMQNTQLMIIKANEPDANTFKDSSIIDGIYYAVDNGANVINLSLGGSYANPITQEAVDYARIQGVVVVAAAGNESSDDPFYPAAFDSTISVSSVDNTSTLSEFSSYGSTIDIAAPGSDILTTARDDKYVYTSGTSLAAPYVSAIIGLMMSYNPSWDYDAIIFQLLNSTVDIGPEYYYGHGLINAYQALTYEFYTVSFQTFDADSIDSQIVAGGELIRPVDDPTLENYVFEGWYLDDTFTMPFDTNEDVVTQDLTLYARFEPSHNTITFVTDGSHVDPMVVARGDTFTLPETTLEGFTFDGWSLDPTEPIWYESEPVYEDLTLYAHFTEIIYHDVSIYFELELLDTYTVEDGQTLTLDPMTRDGYTFNGYFYDDAYTLPYDDSAPITEDTTLYVEFIPDQVTITFVTDGDPIEPLVIDYGSIPVLPDATKDGHYFVDWYLDASFSTRYIEEPLYDDLTLYARFAEDVYTVSYIINDIIIYTQTVESGDTPDLYEPSKDGYDFIGWFLDEYFNNPYLAQSIDTDLTLYGQFDQLEYTIRFYDSGGNLTDTIIIYSGDEVEAPLPPDKPSTLSFHYVFSHWSEDLSTIDSNLDVYPVYDKHFRPESVQLNPGIDTVYLGEPWNDTGIQMQDPDLTISVINPVDIDVAGEYTLIYQIRDDDVIYYEFIRIVTVLPLDESMIEISLNRGISTIIVGGHYIEAGARSNVGSVEIIGDVDTSQAGMTQIIYRVEYEGLVVERVRYVHVVEDQTTMQLIPIYGKKEDDLYA